MSILISANGKQIILKAMLNHTAGQSQYLRLYKNDYTPIESSVTADFTAADFSGYAQKSLTGSSWTVTSSSPYYAYYAKQTWTFSGTPFTSQTIYGYYLVQQSSGLLLWAERFVDPITLIYYQETLSVTPTIYMK